MSTNSSNVVVLIASDKIGNGSDELGTVLMRNFIKNIKTTAIKPTTLIFLNAGINLTTEPTPTINDLKELESTGIRILSCGTCLDYYNAKDKLLVGNITNMGEIVSLLMAAKHVISI